MTIETTTPQHAQREHPAPLARTNGSPRPLEHRSPRPGQRHEPDAVDTDAVAVAGEPEWRQPVVARSFYSTIGKPMFDRSVALIGLVALSPVILAVAAAIRLSMGRGVIFRQDRIGRHGKPFMMLKFRTMQPDRRYTAATYDGPERRLTHKTPQDPRHTRLGRMLRTTSLDELPQLVNVLRSEMSLVGPRPELVSVVEAYGLVEHPRHLVRPGITGLWQVSDLRHELLHLNMHLDIDYVERMGAREDLRILRSTVRSLRNGR